MDKTEKSPKAINDLKTEMRCGILSNRKGEIVIIHDQPIVSKIQWIEYDPNESDFLLVHEDGTVQNLGLPFEDKMKNNLQHGTEVILAYVVNGEFKTTYKTKLVIQDY